jgi:four helix bundle protein
MSPKPNGGERHPARLENAKPPQRADRGSPKPGEPMTNVPAKSEANEQQEPCFDLEERTARFGEAIIAFAKKVPKNDVTLPLISQIVRSGASIGANYCEADEAVSRKDFRHKIGTCKKEAKETKHWLRMIGAAEASMKTEARVLWKEAKELLLIFAAIYRK